MINHHVGNFVVSLPFLESLAAELGPHVDVLVDSRFAGLARLLPSVRHVIPFVQQERRGHRLRQGRYFLSVLRQLWRGRYTLVIDVGGGIQSVTLTTMTWARRRIGLQKSRRSWLYTERLPPDAGIHASDRFMPFARWAGRNDKPKLYLQAAPDARQALASLLPANFMEPGRPIVVIHAGAGYEFRQWPRERFAAAADELVNRWNARVVFIGAPGEDGFLRETIGLMKHSAAAVPLITALDVVVALYERASVLLSNESGPTHLAAATRLPIVTIFGPSKEANWRPVRDENTTVLRGQVCPPECRWGKCRDSLKCVMNVSVDDMVRAAGIYLIGNDLRRGAACGAR